MNAYQRIGLAMLVIAVCAILGDEFGQRFLQSNHTEHVLTELRTEVVPAIEKEIDNKRLEDATCRADRELLMATVPGKIYRAIIHCESKFAYYHTRIEFTRFSESELYWESNGVTMSVKP